MKYLLFCILAFTVLSCNTVVKKDLSIRETETLSGLIIPKNARNFYANSESAMNLFVYAKFELAEENVSDFIAINKLKASENISDDFSAYNKHTSWWDFKKEMHNPSNYIREGKKGKWRTRLNVASSKVEDTILFYVLYYEEP